MHCQEISMCRFRLHSALTCSAAFSLSDFFKTGLNAASKVRLISLWGTCLSTWTGGAFLACVHAAVKWGIRAACHLSLGIALVGVDSVSTLGLSVSIQTWPVLFGAWQRMLMDVSSPPSRCPSPGAGCIPGASSFELLKFVDSCRGWSAVLPSSIMGDVIRFWLEGCRLPAVHKCSIVVDRYPANRFWKLKTMQIEKTRKPRWGIFEIQTQRAKWRWGWVTSLIYLFPVLLD